MGMHTHALSLVVPVYNELENLPKLCITIEQAMQKIGAPEWEAVLVNDGSRDGSGEWLASYCQEHPSIRPVHFYANQGQTAAFDAGIRAARFPLIVTMDADLQNDPNDIPLLIAQLAPGVGAVCGVRVKRQDSLLRLISSKLANRIRNYLSGDNITDTGCSLKLFRRECFERMPMFEGMHRFLPTLVKMEGYTVVEVPVGHFPRFAGSSKYGVWNRIFRSFFDLLAVRWMKKRKLRYRVVEAPNPELCACPPNMQPSEPVGSHQA